MKVKVNIINTWCILMSEAVTVPSLMMMTSLVSEESLASDRHTHRHGLVYVNIFKVLKTINFCVRGTPSRGKAS